MSKRNVGGQIIEWKSISMDIPGNLVKIAQYTMEHPGCFNFTDEQPSYQKYFPLIYKNGMGFLEILEIIFSPDISTKLSIETIETYRDYAAKFFFRILCIQTCQDNISANNRKIISKVFANIYLNCAFGYKNNGRIYGFSEFNKYGQTFCNFSPKTPILTETLHEMTAHVNIFIEDNGIRLLMKRRDEIGIIAPSNWQYKSLNFLI